MEERWRSCDERVLAAAFYPAESCRGCLAFLGLFQFHRRRTSPVSLAPRSTARHPLSFGRTRALPHSVPGRLAVNGIGLSVVAGGQGEVRVERGCGLVYGTVCGLGSGVWSGVWSGGLGSCWITTTALLDKRRRSEAVQTAGVTVSREAAGWPAAKRAARPGEGRRVGLDGGGVGVATTGECCTNVVGG